MTKSACHPRSPEWTAIPVPPVRREVLYVAPDTDERRPPVLFVPGFGHGAWAFAEHWMEHTAGRGFPAHAMSLRGHGAVGGRSDCARTSNVVQVAASLPRQAVLVGHGAGALIVARALARYPARAAVLVAPVFGGCGRCRSALRNPFGTLPAVRRPPAARRGQLFSPSCRLGRRGRTYRARLVRGRRRAQWQLPRGRSPERRSATRRC